MNDQQPVVQPPVQNSKNRKTYTNEEKAMIVAAVQSGMSYTDVEKKYNVTYQSVKSWINKSVVKQPEKVSNDKSELKNKLFEQALKDGDTKAKLMTYLFEVLLK